MAAPSEATRIWLAAAAVLCLGCGGAVSRDLGSAAFYDVRFEKPDARRPYSAGAEFSRFRSVDPRVLDRRVFDYLRTHPETPVAVASALLRYEITPGMDAEQVLLLTFTPGRRKLLDATEEVWTYGSLWPESRCVRIYFVDGRVERVEDRQAAALLDAGPQALFIGR